MDGYWDFFSSLVDSLWNPIGGREWGGGGSTSYLAP